MNTLRIVLSVLTATALASIALPSFADDDEGEKHFTLHMHIVSSPPAPAPFTVTAIITNEGESTIKSFSLAVSGLTIVGVTQPATGQASFTGSSLSVTRMHPLRREDSLAVTLSVSSCGDGAWQPVAWTGSSLNGDRFRLEREDSDLATSLTCGSLAAGVSFTVPDSVNPECAVSGERGYYDEDGSTPAGSLPFYVTNTIASNGELHFRWPVDNSGDPLATFDYSICASGPLPAAGVAQVAWLNANGSPASTPGTPAFVTAQDCLYPPAVLPTPYGTLVTSLTPTASMVSVDTTTPSGGPPAGSIPYPVPKGTPFDIVIGTERITVKLVCNDNDGDPDPADPNECSEPGEGPILAVVLRGVGGTTAVNHSAGVLVMSTPLPLLPAGVPAPYIAGDQALMCIAGETGDSESSTHSTTFFDIGDGWANHP